MKTQYLIGQEYISGFEPCWKTQYTVMSSPLLKVLVAIVLLYTTAGTVVTS